MIRVCVLLLLLALSPASAHAMRVALVVGINKYDNLPRERQIAKAVNGRRVSARVAKTFA